MTKRRRNRPGQQRRLLLWLVPGVIILIGIFAYVQGRNGALSEANNAIQLENNAAANQFVETVTPLPAPGATTTMPLLASSPVSPLPQTTAANPTALPPPAFYTYRVINTYPHDVNAFTQGLIYHDDILYEGTGLYGQSTIRKVRLATGEVLQVTPIDAQYFGEGITIFGDDLIQLTWKSQTGLVYDKDSFALKGRFSYPTEGWGITHDGQHLIMSDGSANLTFIDPVTFQPVRQIEANDRGNAVLPLNELEYVNGQIYANVWKTEMIVMVNPDDGVVTGWLDLSGLLAPEDRQQRVDVLNGIAYDQSQNRLFVTGKWWPKLFEIEPVLVE